MPASFNSLITILLCCQCNSCKEHLRLKDLFCSLRLRRLTESLYFPFSVLKAEISELCRMLWEQWGGISSELYARWSFAKCSRMGSWLLQRSEKTITCCNHKVWSWKEKNGEQSVCFGEEEVVALGRWDQVAVFSSRSFKIQHLSN